MAVTEDLDEVVALAAEVAALRQRLAQLDAERATISGQIADYVNRIASAAVAAGTPPPAASPAAVPVDAGDPLVLSTEVIHILRRSPEKVFTALEIADILQMTDVRDHGAIRTHLSRMAKDGRATRVSFGKYKAAR